MMLPVKWDDITSPLLNLSGCTVEVWEWINDLILHNVVDVIIYAEIKTKHFS